LIHLSTYPLIHLSTYPLINKQEETNNRQQEIDNKQQRFVWLTKYKREYSDEKYGFNTRVNHTIWGLCC
ncbi:hypothetical protein AB6C79_10885, partial [Vibrio splendidus]